MVTGAQLRAARGLLSVTVARVAEETGLAINTIRRAEGTNEAIPVTAANARVLRLWFEERGVFFISAEDGLGVGVRLISDVSESRPSLRRTGASD